VVTKDCITSAIRTDIPRETVAAASATASTMTSEPPSSNNKPSQSRNTGEGTGQRVSRQVARKSAQAAPIMSRPSQSKDKGKARQSTSMPSKSKDKGKAPQSTRKTGVSPSYLPVRPQCPHDNPLLAVSHIRNAPFPDGPPNAALKVIYPETLSFKHVERACCSLLLQDGG
jgi:hypothetical protein